MNRYCITVSYQSEFEYYVDAENEDDARDMADKCISEDASNIISGIQCSADITVNEC